MQISDRLSTPPVRSARAAVASSFASIDDILDEARNGRPFIVVDSDDPRTSGTIVAPAQFATPDRINLMAVHARGLVCLALTSEHAERLNLAPMTPRGAAPADAAAFTVSIEASTGVTTGISAHDRARTIAAAIDATSTPEDIVSPGHIFPVIARDGGTLVRAGHVEAAVDICRAAGLTPAAAICQVMSDDGEVAGLDELVHTARLLGLKLFRVADLIQHRRTTENLLVRSLTRRIQTGFGAEFDMIIYRNRLDGAEHIAMVKGTVDPDHPTLVRVHAIDLAADLFGQQGERRGLVPRALEALAGAEGAGVAIFLRNPEVSWSQHYGERADQTAPALSLREYGIGAHMLRDLGVREMILLTDNPPKLSALGAYGLSVVGARRF